MHVTPTRQPQTMFGTDTDNPLEPNAIDNTLPFAANGLFRLPRHMVDDTPPDEPTLRANPGMGMAFNAIFAESTNVRAAGDERAIIGISMSLPPRKKGPPAKPEKKTEERNPDGGSENVENNDKKPDDSRDWHSDEAKWAGYFGSDGNPTKLTPKDVEDKLRKYRKPETDVFALCDKAKYRFTISHSWAETRLIGREVDKISAANLAEAARDACESELDDVELWESAIAEVLQAPEEDGGYGWLCDKPCKLVVDLVLYHASISVEAYIVTLEKGSPQPIYEYYLWVYKSISAVFDVQCVSK